MLYIYIYIYISRWGRKYTVIDTLCILLFCPRADSAAQHSSKASWNQRRKSASSLSARPGQCSASNRGFDLLIHTDTAQWKRLYLPKVGSEADGIG